MMAAFFNRHQDIWTRFRAYMTSPMYWSILGAVTLLCAFVGPFGTASAFPMAYGLVYWGLSICLTAPMGSLIIAGLQVRRWPGLKLILAIVLGFGVFVSLIILGVSWVLLTPVGAFPGVLDLVFYSFVSSVFILLAMVLIMNRSGLFRHTDEGDLADMGGRPKLLNRLPELAQARQVWALSAQDHYVRVVTDAGAGLCLIRLCDAIDACAGTKGMRIHRSHWVAVAAIENKASVRKDGCVKLPTGESMPISKSRAKALYTALERFP